MRSTGQGERQGPRRLPGAPHRRRSDGSVRGVAKGALGRAQGGGSFDRAGAPGHRDHDAPGHCGRAQRTGAHHAPGWVVGARSGPASAHVRDLIVGLAAALNAQGVPFFVAGVAGRAKCGRACRLPRLSLLGLHCARTRHSEVATLRTFGSVLLQPESTQVGHSRLDWVVSKADVRQVTRTMPLCSSERLPSLMMGSPCLGSARLSRLIRQRSDHRPQPSGT